MVHSVSEDIMGSHIVYKTMVCKPYVSLEPKHVANYVLIECICAVFDWINYFIIPYNTTGWLQPKRTYFYETSKSEL
jgi:hypothetical protein